MIIFVTIAAVFCGLGLFFYTQVQVAQKKAHQAVEAAMFERQRAMQAEKLAKESMAAILSERLLKRNTECQLIALNAKMESIGQVNGTIDIFEHEHDQFEFWHATVVVTGPDDELNKWHLLAEKGNVKIRLELDTGETAIATLAAPRPSKEPPSGMITLGLIGLNQFEE